MISLWVTESITWRIVELPTLWNLTKRKNSESWSLARACSAVSETSGSPCSAERRPSSKPRWRNWGVSSTHSSAAASSNRQLKHTDSPVMGFSRARAK
eukprot:CAMPEP_0181440678 /NCGR_PEP_ID=MMETSP1110-20121109/23097_1 /TAXON_ID=174948 /ORGANISM="Symbiodinium sp., Strain CCMP421" /LENGTH=97 /DNA_ID=CAMNT_0023564501 /DNA_START=769 /DNA_END=1062 /DNA_ORIENTATION=-